MIYDKFLKSNAEMEMCISGRRRVAIESKRENPPKNIFAAVQHDVWVALTTECVPRFCRSEIFLVSSTHTSSMLPIRHMVNPLSS